MRVRVFVSIATILLGTTCSARAAEGDIFQFFEQGFGGPSSGTAQRLPQPSYLGQDSYSYGDEDDAPPVVIRPHRHRAHVATHPERTPKEVAEDIKNTTIYTDRTLTRGDIVMTKGGLRVFNGSDAFPHTDEDFVALATDRRMPSAMRTELHSIDVASRIVATGY